MRYTIKPRQGEPLTFWAPDNGGYIRLESNGRSGTLGQQICTGGGFTGSTLSAWNFVELKEIVQQWYKQNKRNCKY